jgi:ribosomal protein S18 acetylase RimI-like enzyme
VRQGTAVDPDYQRMGFGRMIVRKCNEVADAAGKLTFARTRPTSLKLFEEEGYKLLEEIEIPYKEYGMEGESKVFAMKREVGGV